jgi:hypothetical protein
MNTASIEEITPHGILKRPVFDNSCRAFCPHEESGNANFMDRTAHFSWWTITGQKTDSVSLNVHDSEVAELISVRSDVIQTEVIVEATSVKKGWQG